MDTLTIMRPVGGERMGKKFTLMPSGKIYVESYGRTYRYNAEEVTVDDIESLSKAIREVSKDPTAFVIRGKPIDQTHNIRRLKIKCKKTGDMPTIEEVDRRWLCIDIDDVTIDPVRGVVGSAIAALPECFHGVACHYQMSSSAGVFESGLAKVHLWYWLDRAAFGKSLRGWLKPWPVDVTLYSGVQPHYTADPVFVRMEDPEPERHGFIQGAPSVELPEEVLSRADFLKRENEREKERLAAIEAQMKIRKMHPGFDDDFKGVCRRYASKSLSRACDQICTATTGNRHLKIYSESAGIAEMADHLDEHTAKAELKRAGMLALQGEGRDQEVERTVEDGWEEGLQNPRDLRFLVVERMVKQPREKEKHSAAALFAIKMGEDPEELQKSMGAQGLRIPSASSEAVDFFSDLVLLSLNEYREKYEQSEVGVYSEEQVESHRDLSGE